MLDWIVEHNHMDSLELDVETHLWRQILYRGSQYYVTDC
jgi:hypothetical protein